MKHCIDGAIHLDRLGNIVADEREPGMTLKSGEVFQAAGNQAVHAANLVPRGKQLLAKMASQKTCPAGNDNPQQIPFLAVMLSPSLSP